MPASRQQQNGSGYRSRVELTGLVREATASLVRMDADRLEELARCCRDLNREPAERANQRVDVQAVRQPEQRLSQFDGHNQGQFRDQNRNQFDGHNQGQFRDQNRNQFSDQNRDQFRASESPDPDSMRDLTGELSQELAAQRASMDVFARLLVETRANLRVLSHLYALRLRAAGVEEFALSGLERSGREVGYGDN